LRPNADRPASAPRPGLYVALAVVWTAAVALTHGLGRRPTNLGAWTGWGLIQLLWLPGFRDILVTLFRMTGRRHDGPSRQMTPAIETSGELELPSVAVLYTTCNDFCEAAANACVALDYPAFTVYLLDDSNDARFSAAVDAFALRHPRRVVVIRRPSRAGFKAGNLNNALSGPAAGHQLFAIVDADEIVPRSFLRRMVPLLLAHSELGFVQANHRYRRLGANRFQRELGIGVDIHWKWYQPVKNTHGCVVLLGHGAVIQRSCWQSVGGFPELVSEDLAFSARARREGWRGHFAEDVVCYEAFPPSLRAFRRRHMKWVRGACEFIAKEGLGLLRARQIRWFEKADILLPLVGLMLSGATLIVWGAFAFSAFAWPRAGGHHSPGVAFVAFSAAALLGPTACFVVELSRRPLRLFGLLGVGTIVYGGLAVLSAIGLLGYTFSRRAIFLVTGDTRHDGGKPFSNWIAETSPSDSRTQSIELLASSALLVFAASHRNVLLMAMGASCALHPAIHRTDWDRRVWRAVRFLPFTGMIVAIALIVWHSIP